MPEEKSTKEEIVVNLKKKKSLNEKQKLLLKKDEKLNTKIETITDHLIA